MLWLMREATVPLPPTRRICAEVSLYRRASFGRLIALRCDLTATEPPIGSTLNESRPCVYMCGAEDMERLPADSACGGCDGRSDTTERADMPPTPHTSKAVPSACCRVTSATSPPEGVFPKKPVRHAVPPEEGRSWASWLCDTMRTPPPFRPRRGARIPWNRD